MDTNLNLTAFILLTIIPLIARYYVHLGRNKFETPELEVFIVLLEKKFSAKKKLQKQTEISSNTEIVDHPVHF